MDFTTFATIANITTMETITKVSTLASSPTLPPHDLAPTTPPTKILSPAAAMGIIGGFFGLLALTFVITGIFIYKRRPGKGADAEPIEMLKTVVSRSYRS
ncbi:hypothetical protein F5B22DRAFT_646268 [Xylaria bambusicola]|uniref:uncharacterized protein n=1 Tax=Xylaria bambusicola TaxID=326684 RepID=UPI0020084024|nr:uncharacterized protein F5B22DRAFT_646268 [Xylaria bambusicola]KAI0516924.1 hypothetical protein F5B22DRAFT_646268 [Xylaria bambusicola]